jgi:PKHD-type hydroxylase
MTPRGREFEPYVWMSGQFSTDELDRLQYEAGAASDNAVITQEGIYNPDVRSSKVKWIESSDMNHRWLFERLDGIIQELNNRFYNFDINSFGESLQLTTYDTADNGHYDWHIDMGGKVSRKLSLVLQLSDPLDYDGGNLEISTAAEPIIVPKERGLVSVFPSWCRHRVSPVTRGTRQSLVVWMSGPNFR